MRLAYGRALRPILIAFVPVLLVEVAVTELLVPVAELRLLLFAVSAAFLVWYLGLIASVTARSHTLSGRELTLRCMVFDVIEVPLEHLERVSVGRRSGIKRSVEYSSADETLAMSVLGSTNVTLEFRRAITTGGDREHGPVRRVQFAVDEPEAAAAHLRPLAAAAGAG